MPVGDLVYPAVFRTPEPPTPVFAESAKTFPPQPPPPPQSVFHAPILAPDTHPPDVTFFDAPTPVKTDVALQSQPFLFVAPEVAIDVVFFSQPPPQPTEVSLEKPTLIFVTPATHPPDIIFSESPPPPPPPPWLFQQNHHFVEAPAPPQPDFIAVPAQVPFQVAAFLPLGEIFIVVIPGPRGDESFSRGWYHTK